MLDYDKHANSIPSHPIPSHPIPSIPSISPSLHPSVQGSGASYHVEASDHFESMHLPSSNVTYGACTSHNTTQDDLSQPRMMPQTIELLTSWVFLCLTFSTFTYSFEKTAPRNSTVNSRAAACSTVLGQAALGSSFAGYRHRATEELMRILIFKWMSSFPRDYWTNRSHAR